MGKIWVFSSEFRIVESELQITKKILLWVAYVVKVIWYWFRLDWILSQLDQNSVPTLSKFNPTLIKIQSQLVQNSSSYRLRMGSWLWRGASTVNEGFVLFVDYFLHRLVEQIYPRLAIVIGQSWCSSISLIAPFLLLLWTPKVLFFAAYD
jgi:hypothetical protein